MPTDNILLLLLGSILTLKSSLIGGFSTRFDDNSEVTNFLLGHPVDRPPENLMYPLTN